MLRTLQLKEVCSCRMHVRRNIFHFVVVVAQHRLPCDFHSSGVLQNDNNNDVDVGLLLSCIYKYQ